ncbi:hypothetical protein CY35_16G090600 [Sphagnum magellanicum]|nr:hypothetical protein CY35_16G090600 [Sphagnum magellanicum]
MLLQAPLCVAFIIKLLLTLPSQTLLLLLASCPYFPAPEDPCSPHHDLVCPWMM